MKKEFTAYCFNASGSAAKRVKIEVTNYSYNGAPVANIWTAPTPFDSFEIYVEFRGILVYYRTFSPDTLERENVAGLLARVGSEFLELVTSGRVYPSFPVLAAIQAVGSPEELAAAVEAREAVQKYERERDEERERERVEAERREREREERERVEAIQDAKEKVLQGENITGLQLVYLLHHYGVTVHPRTLHNIHEVRTINGVTLSYNRPASGRKMKVDTIFEVFADVAGRIKDEAKRERVEAPAVAVDQVPAPVAVPEAVEAPAVANIEAVAGVACSFTVAGSLEADGLTGAPYEHSEKSQNSGKIEDFGQKIGGAHKDRAREAAERLAGVDASALILKPLAQVAKLPDLRGLYLSGTITEAQARQAWYLWSQIGPKPGSSWPTRVQNWAAKAAGLIAAVADILAYGYSEKSQISEDWKVVQPWDLFTEEMEAANWPAEEYKRGTYFVGRYWLNGARYSIHTASSSYCKAFDTVAEAVAAIREKVGKNTAKSGQKWDVYKNAAGYWISPKGKPGIKVAQFQTKDEVWAAYGDTEKLENLYAELKKFPAERRDWNRPRLGQDWRKGQDLTPEAFGQVFPFRGVEFGNWVSQTERAANLNECADALQDMAAVLGIRPEAVTLSGSLAWAFGSRGIGKALAHYEPARRVINLTKKKGNGCVAHEWFHALDNYLMIKAGKPSLYMVGDCYAYGNTEKSPIFKAAEALKAALLKSDMYTRSKRIDEFKTKPYWATVVEMAARAFEAVIYYKLEAAGMCNDYLVNITPADEYSRSNCYPYPTREEAAQLAPLYDAFILAAFSEAERAPIAGGEAYEDSEKSQILEKLEAIREAILNESVSYGEIAYLQDHAEYIKPDDTLLLEWAGVPEYPEDEAPAVAASEPMNEDSTNHTPADGVQGAAYGDCEKSQNFERDPKTVSLNSKLERCHLDGLAFRTNSGEIQEYGRNDWAFFITGLGWVSMPDDDGLPYTPIGGRKALGEIKGAGGFLNYDGFQFVWPVDPTKPISPTIGRPEGISREDWDAFNEEAQHAPIGFRQYIYGFIEKSLNPAPVGIEWNIMTPIHWGIVLNVSGKKFFIYFDRWNGTIHFAHTVRPLLETCAPMSWCHALDGVLSPRGIAFSWPIPDKFHALIGIDLDGKPIYAGF